MSTKPTPTDVEKLLGDFADEVFGNSVVENEIESKLRLGYIHRRLEKYILNLEADIKRMGLDLKKVNAQSTHSSKESFTQLTGRLGLVKGTSFHAIESLSKESQTLLNEEELCTCREPVTGDYGICSSPECK